MTRRRRQSGFSLIELAVVLVIIGLLVGGGIAAITAGTEQGRRAEQERQFERIRAALHGFAMVHGRLPCAHTDHPEPGRENYDAGAGACESGADRGALPWVTLGLGRRDAWNNRLYYAVTDDYADDPDPDEDSSFDFASEANLDIEDGDGNFVAEDTPAVVVSFGPQGEQVWTAGGFQCPGPGGGFSEDESENCDGDGDFVSAGYRPADAVDGRFDDMLLWISDAVLKARMVEAERLP